MAIPWKFVVLVALAVLTAVLIVIVTTGGAAGVTAAEPIVSYEELTRIVGPVAI
jgi:hypothetical protein